MSKPVRKLWETKVIQNKEIRNINKSRTNNFKREESATMAMWGGGQKDW